MSYSDWTNTSTTYRHYENAAARSAAVFSLRQRRTELASAEAQWTTVQRGDWLAKGYKARATAARETVEALQQEIYKVTPQTWTAVEKAAIEQRKAERNAERSAEQRSAQETAIAAEHRAILETERGPLATDKQVTFMVTLQQRRLIAIDLMLMDIGPAKTADELRIMTRREASQYIDRLKADF